MVMRGWKALLLVQGVMQVGLLNYCVLRPFFLRLSSTHAILFTYSFCLFPRVPGCHIAQPPHRHRRLQRSTPRCLFRLDYSTLLNDD